MKEYDIINFDTILVRAAMGLGKTQQLLKSLKKFLDLMKNRQKEDDILRKQIKDKITRDLKNKNKIPR